MLDGRFSFVADAYVKNTVKGIFGLDVPITTGYTTITTNAIGTQNKGLEMTFIAHYFKPSRAFQWETDFNIAFNNNEVTKLPNGGRDILITMTDKLYFETRAANKYVLCSSKPGFIKLMRMCL